jgi:hypothetical protein
MVFSLYINLVFSLSCIDRQLSFCIPSLLLSTEVVSELRQEYRLEDRLGSSMADNASSNETLIPAPTDTQVWREHYYNAQEHRLHSVDKVSNRVLKTFWFG